jgi:hypothetical protein
MASMQGSNSMESCRLSAVTDTAMTNLSSEAESYARIPHGDATMQGKQGRPCFLQRLLPTLEAQFW